MAQCNYLAEYLMGKYNLALEHFVHLAHTDQNTAEVHNWWSQCKAQMVEAKGTYNWKVIYDVGNSQSQYLDVSDFVDPIEVTLMPHQGGGRASWDIKTGDLLVCTSFNI